jgi:hypothetical protein
MSDVFLFPIFSGRNENNSLRAIDKNVSMIGSPSANIGINMANPVGAFVELFRDNIASINPSNKLPESPRNILAGLKLYLRNPSREPTNKIVILAVARSPRKIAIGAIVNAAIIATPDASPSRPSIRFRAFVIPIIHNSVNGKSNIPNENTVPANIVLFMDMPNPEKYTINANTN